MTYVQAILCSIFVSVIAKDRRKNNTIPYKEETVEVNSVKHSDVFRGYKR